MSPMSNNELFDLTGRVAIVTGASRGLGQYFARALAKSGADLVITSRTLDSLREFEGEIKSLGRRAVPLELDVRDPESIEAMAVGRGSGVREDGHSSQQCRHEHPKTCD